MGWLGRRGWRRSKAKGLAEGEDTWGRGDTGCLKGKMGKRVVLCIKWVVGSSRLIKGAAGVDIISGGGVKHVNNTTHHHHHSCLKE